MSRGPGALTLPWAIAWRYLRGRRSRLLDGTARAALVATAIGVLAMLIAMALMTGYRGELEKKLIGANAAVVAYPILAQGQASLEPGHLEQLRRLPGVQRVDAVGFGQGVLSSAAVPQGLEVSLRGVAPGGAILGGVEADLEDGADGVAAAVLGDELLSALQAKPGDVLRLSALQFDDGKPRFSYRSLRVAASFHTGFSEFDRRWLVMDRERVATNGQRGGGFYELRLDDPETAPAIAERAGEILGAAYLVTHWQEMNGELFTALRLQQLILFLVLGLIVVVSTFNVASTLVVLVRERMRDIGVLTAMGLAPAAVRTLFVLYGGFLGLFGTLLGVTLGCSAAWTLDHFHLIRFDADVAAIYFLSSVPFQIRAVDVAAVVGFALIVNLAACIGPAWRASSIQPATALHYE